MSVSVPRGPAPTASPNTVNFLPTTTSPDAKPLLGLAAEQLDLWSDGRDPSDWVMSYVPPKSAPRVAEPTSAPLSQLGDLWLLGRHRLLVGDATKPKNHRKLFGVMRADMILTDPPYVVDVAMKNRRFNATGRGRRCQRSIVGDTFAETPNPKDLYRDSIRSIPMMEYNTAYVFMSGSQAHNWALAAAEAGFRGAGNPFLVWRKNQAILGHGDYNNQHELIWYGWKGKHAFYGTNKATSVFDCPRPHRSEHHPAQKPIELLKTLMSHGAPDEGIIADPFLGSGQTLFAAEETGRYCYGMELDTTCADIILRRWMAAGGEDPELYERDGEPSFLTLHRGGTQ